MTGGNEPAIAAAGLTKRYGKTAALCDVSLQASAGTVTALLGPNGAGKTGAAVRAGASIERFSLREPDLDDVYFQLTGHARPAGAAGDAA